MSKGKIGKNLLKKKILEDAKKNELLRFATVEITDFCNYRCGYCYVHDYSKSYINKNEFFWCIDELFSMGCMYLIITGGEPLLHPDFSEMYQYAAKRIPFISLFTNGSMLNGEHIELFKKFPLYEIEITLYGVNEDSYEDFVGRKGMFTCFEKSLQLLKEIDVDIVLKSVLNKKNLQDYELLVQYAEKNGVRFRYDSIVVPRMDSDKQVLDEFRLDPADAAKLLMHHTAYINRIRNELYNDEEQVDNHRYLCDAGITSVFIDANMRLSYCVLVRKPFYDLRAQNATLRNGKTWLMQNRAGYLRHDNKCFDCKLKQICRYCPGRFALETGNELVPSEWNCLFAKELVKCAVPGFLDDVT